jgi:ABC-type multidrug transport system fused ATPase/permease subunit
MSEPPPSPAAVSLPNGVLVRRLFGLAWRYRLHCVSVLLIQLVLLTMGIAGLSFTGLGIDYIRHRVVGVPLGENPLHLVPPADWPPLQVLALLAGLILVLALSRAVLNYAYAVSVNKLVQQKLVVDLRAEVYDKLQRLSFRFFDANTTGSIITRVTGDVQSVRMFVDQVLIQSVIMVISLTVYVAYMVRLQPGLTLACLATTPLLAMMSMWFSGKIQPLYAHNRTLFEKMVQVLAESIQGIAVTKGFGREAEDRAKFDTANQAVVEQQHGIFWRVSLFSPAVGLLTRINMLVLPRLRRLAGDAGPAAAGHGPDRLCGPAGTVLRPGEQRGRPGEQRAAVADRRAPRVRDPRCAGRGGERAQRRAAAAAHGRGAVRPCLLHLHRTGPSRCCTTSTST